MDAMPDNVLKHLPAFLRPNTPGTVAAGAAARHGITLSQAAAEDIAEAVLGFAHGEHRVTITVSPELWPQHRDVALERLRRYLAMELADKELLPTTLPREVVTPPPHRQPWEGVKVELVVPVRRAR